MSSPPNCHYVLTDLFTFQIFIITATFLHQFCNCSRMIRFAGGPFITMIMNVLGRFSYQSIVQSQPTRQHKSRFNHGHSTNFHFSSMEQVLFLYKSEDKERRTEYDHVQKR